MPISSELNKIKFVGELSAEENLRLLAAMYSIVEKKGFGDFTLDFSSCSKAYTSQMLLVCARCQSYWKQGIDVSLVLPADRRMERLFLNTNWAHLIDGRAYEPSRFRGYTHAPAIKFTDGKEQHQAVNKLLDVLMAAIAHFQRDDIRYIEWAINEITDNVINHSESPVGGFVQVTNFRQRQQIELTVCDAGIGIPESLRTSHQELNSDREALDVAIREGVTRDKSFGQGNGLYGTWRIAQKSGGEFQIISGHADLTSSERKGLHIGKINIPVNGTLVRTRIGYSRKIDLSDALVFSGREYIPVDYIETHFDEDKFGNINFVLKNEADGFGSRAAGEPVRRKLLNIINCLDGGRVLIDCKDIPLVSSSFADELFGKLFIEMGLVEFTTKVEFKNLDPLVKNLIDHAVLQRMNQ